MSFLDNILDSVKDAFLNIPVVKQTTNYIKSIPCHMDFEGQKKAEKLYQVIITVFGVVGFLYGYVVEQFSQTVLVLAVGFILSCLLVLPPWPFYRRNPLPWQKTGGSTQESTETPPDSKPKSKDSKKKKTQ